MPPGPGWRSATRWDASAACSSGDGDYGSPTKSFIGIAFPHGTVPTPPGVKVWPTPPIETVVMLIVCYVLYRMAKRPQPGWYVWGWFMVLAGVERFLIEFIRRNPVVFLGLRTTQWESIASVAIGVAIILWTKDRQPVEATLVPAHAARRRQWLGRPSRIALGAAAAARRQDRPARDGGGAPTERLADADASPARPSALGRHGHQQQRAGRVVEQPPHEQRAAGAVTPLQATTMRSAGRRAASATITAGGSPTRTTVRCRPPCGQAAKRMVNSSCHDDHSYCSWSTMRGAGRLPGSSGVSAVPTCITTISRPRPQKTSSVTRMASEAEGLPSSGTRTRRRLAIGRMPRRSTKRV